MKVELPVYDPKGDYMRYPFLCEEHGEVEVICSMKDVQKEMPCPTCGKLCTRIYKAPQIAFKGGDWASKKPKEINTNDDWISRRQKEKWD